MIGTTGSGISYAGAVGMLLHINGMFTIGNLKSSLLSSKFSFLTDPHYQFLGVGLAISPPPPKKKPDVAIQYCLRTEKVTRPSIIYVVRRKLFSLV